MSSFELSKIHHPDFQDPRRKPTEGVEVDRTNFFGKNIFALWNFATNSTWLEDATNKKLAEKIGSTVNLGSGDGNQVLLSTGDANTDRLKVGSISSSNPLSLSAATVNGTYTIFFRCRIPSGALTNTFPRMIDKSSAGNATDGWMVHFPVAKERIELLIDNGATTFPGPVIDRDTWHNGAIVVDNGAGTFYIDDKTPATIGSVADGSNTTTDLSIANWNHTTDRNWNGEISYIHMHHAAYSSGQVKQYWRNPNQVLEPQIPLTYSTPEVAGGITLTPTGIPSSEAFGTPDVLLGTLLTPSGIPSSEAFSTPTIVFDPLTVTPTGIASSEAFGTPDVLLGTLLTPSGIPSSEAFGTPTILQEILVEMAGIPSSQAFGKITLVGDIFTTPQGGIFAAYYTNVFRPYFRQYNEREKH